MPHAAGDDNARGAAGPENGADHESHGVWVKRWSLSVWGFDPDSVAVTSYDPMAADLLQVDLDLDPRAVDPDPTDPYASSLDPADPAALDQKSPWDRIDRELRSVHAELADLRREVRALRTQHTERR